MSLQKRYFFFALLLVSTMLACKDENQVKSTRQDDLVEPTPNPTNISTDTGEVYKEVTYIPLKKEPIVGRIDRNTYSGTGIEATIDGKYFLAKAGKAGDTYVLHLIEGEETIFSVDLDKAPLELALGDLNSDNVLEVFMIAQPAGEFTPNQLVAYAKSGSTYKEIVAPQLPLADLKLYRGGDQIIVEGNRIKRSFPLFKDGDVDQKPSGGIRTIYYSFDGRQFKVIE